MKNRVIEYWRQRPPRPSYLSGKLVVLLITMPIWLPLIWWLGRVIRANIR